MEEIRTKLENAICRIDSMQAELDDHDGRLYSLESNQRVQKLQLAALQKLQISLDEQNRTILNINDTVVETKHRLAQLAKEGDETKERVLALERQRNIDHNDKPLGRYEKMMWIIISAVLGAIVMLVLTQIGLAS